MDEQLHVLLISKGDDVWVAQCIQHDIAEQGHGMAEAMENLVAVLSEHISLDIADGEKPLSGIEPAPTKYRDMWVRANLLEMAELDRFGRNQSSIQSDLMDAAPPAWMISGMVNELRKVI